MVTIANVVDNEVDEPEERFICERVLSTKYSDSTEDSDDIYYHRKFIQKTADIIAKIGIVLIFLYVYFYVCENI